MMSLTFWLPGPMYLRGGGVLCLGVSPPGGCGTAPLDTDIQWAATKTGGAHPTGMHSFSVQLSAKSHHCYLVLFLLF